MSKTPTRMIRVQLDGEELDDPASSRPNRSERTRDAAHVNKLGTNLTKLRPVDLDTLDLPEELREAIDICQGLKAQAQSRQRRLVAKVLRSENHEAIREQFEQLQAKRKSRPLKPRNCEKTA